MTVSALALLGAIAIGAGLLVGGFTLRARAMDAVSAHSANEGASARIAAHRNHSHVDGLAAAVGAGSVAQSPGGSDRVSIGGSNGVIDPTSDPSIEHDGVLDRGSARATHSMSEAPTVPVRSGFFARFAKAIGVDRLDELTAGLVRSEIDDGRLSIELDPGAPLRGVRRLVDATKSLAGHAGALVTRRPEVTLRIVNEQGDQSVPLAMDDSSSVSDQGDQLQLVPTELAGAQPASAQHIADQVIDTPPAHAQASADGGAGNLVPATEIDSEAEHRLPLLGPAAVLLVQGATESRADDADGWRALTPALVAAGHRVIVVEERDVCDVERSHKRLATVIGALREVGVTTIDVVARRAGARAVESFLIADRSSDGAEHADPVDGSDWPDGLDSAASVAPPFTAAPSAPAASPGTMSDHIVRRIVVIAMCADGAHGSIGSDAVNRCDETEVRTTRTIALAVRHECLRGAEETSSATCMEVLRIVRADRPGDAPLARLIGEPLVRAEGSRAELGRRAEVGGHPIACRESWHTAPAHRSVIEAVLAALGPPCDPHLAVARHDACAGSR